MSNKYKLSLSNVISTNNDLIINKYRLSLSYVKGYHYQMQNKHYKSWLPNAKELLHISNSKQI